MNKILEEILYPPTRAMSGLFGSVAGFQDGFENNQNGLGLILMISPVIPAAAYFDAWKEDKKTAMKVAEQNTGCATIGLMVGYVVGKGIGTIAKYCVK